MSASEKTGVPCEKSMRGFVAERVLTDAGVDAADLCRDHEFAEAMAICLWANYWSLNSITRIERQFGLNRDDCNVILSLWRYGQLTATDISIINGRPKNSIGRAVKRLLDSDLIQTTVDNDDTRKKLLRMTQRGSDVLEDIKPIFTSYQETMLTHITPHQRDTIHRLLLKTFTDVNKWRED